MRAFVLSWLVLACCMRAHAQAAPRSAAPVPSRATSPAVTQNQRAIAVPSCFGDCGEHRVKTAAGVCVPAELPAQTAPSAHPLEVTPMPEEPLAKEAGSAAPEGAGERKRPCLYVSLAVEASGIKNLGDRAEASPQRADVRINGQLVGTTPFADQLPVGDYLVEVVDPVGDLRRTVARLRPGAHQKLSAVWSLLLDAEEVAAREAWRRERLESWRGEKAAAASAERTRRAAERRTTLAAAQQEYVQRHGQWDQEMQPKRAERARGRLVAEILFGTGAAFLIAGTALELTAAAANDDAQKAQRQWLVAVSEQARADWVQRAKDAEHRRDVQHVLGLSALGLGAGSAIAGAVFLLSVPALTEEPRPPDATPLARRMSLRVSPLVTRSAFGVGLRMHM